MKEKSNDSPGSPSSLILYQTEDGRSRIEVRLENETVWLTQQLMAELFQTTKQNVGQHLKNIFAEGELQQDSVVKKSFTTAADGKQYETPLYSLDAIISVGYRVNSLRGDRWCGLHNEDRRNYLRNAYRVLLTRARQGMVIFVPPGEANDPTRTPAFYDSTFRYRSGLGMPVLPK